jgi:hypothetical protein
MKPIYEKHSLVSLREALESLHQTSKPVILDAKSRSDMEIGDPESSTRTLDFRFHGNDNLVHAKKRLAFDEMFYLIKDVMTHKKGHQASSSVAKLTTTNDDITTFYKLLPFAPTPTPAPTPPKPGAIAGWGSDGEKSTGGSVPPCAIPGKSGVRDGGGQGWWGGREGAARVSRRLGSFFSQPPRNCRGGER